MSIERIREDVRLERITFGPHLIERMVENVLNGNVLPVGQFSAPLYQPTQHA
jgi:hypothetical protein